MPRHTILVHDFAFYTHTISAARANMKSCETITLAGLRAIYMIVWRPPMAQNCIQAQLKVNQACPTYFFVHDSHPIGPT